MRAAVLAVIAAGLCVASTAVPAQDALSIADDGQPRGYVLVIGVSDYDGNGKVEPEAEALGAFQPDLTNARKDAVDVAAMFTRLKYEVTLLKDPDFSTMNSAVADFVDKMAKIDAAGPVSKSGRGQPIAVIYLAGHGIEYGGTNYFLPAKTVLPDPSVMRDRSLAAGTQSLEGKAVPIGDLVDLLSDRPGAVSLIVVDACRNNPWARRVRSGSRRASVVEAGLAPMEPGGDGRSVTLLAFSARPGRVASDGSGKPNSPFAAAFMTFMVRQDLSFSDAFGEVSDYVRGETSGDQSAWLSGSPGGKFCLPGCLVASAVADAGEAQYRILADAYRANTIPAWENAIGKLTQADLLAQARDALRAIKEQTAEPGLDEVPISSELILGVIWPTFLDRTKSNVVRIPSRSSQIIVSGFADFGSSGKVMAAPGFSGRYGGAYLKLDVPSGFSGDAVTVRVRVQKMKSSFEEEYYRTIPVRRRSSSQ